jgi:hypothetical protein
VLFHRDAVGFEGENTTDLGETEQLPRAEFAVPGLTKKGYDESGRQQFVHVDDTTWTLTSQYTLIVYSQPACDGISWTIQIASSGTSLILYIRFIASIWTVACEKALTRFDKVWIGRLDAPQKTIEDVYGSLPMQR